MNRYTAAIATITMSAGIATPTIVQAQVDDHLRCYRVTESAMLRARVDLDLSAAGIEENCRVRKTRLFCVPGTKTVRRAEVDGTPIDPLPVFGDKLTDARICYRLACRDEPTAIQATDQFGTHDLQRKRSGLLCTPAFEEPPGPATTLAPSCLSDGDCDDADPCTDDECASHGAGSSTCFNHPLDNCCENDGGCDDADPCTTDSCNLTTNQCEFVPTGAPECTASSSDSGP